ncbi:monovalent cation/H(+) antiporter subunit G [Comamonas sp. NLF-1-9]|uniref:cation:proton antiporter n=1 Tax=Comamonas sp. NLF-1-9 TaxID=2853163 RepID=UPI001C45FF9F|nr:monovalent cation/H(+) antiporter subunit G [Comamonas sp. NLF-1-9]QXL85058.1 monovalent cation/H(+) antiporter subunit G [Comamonas sp. NLF-1-9]
MNAMPLWLDILVSLLALAGAAIALVASMGLLTLPSFFARTHPPAMIATLACWCILHAAFAYFWWATGSAPLRLYLIAFFVAITVPITSVFLMRAALFRARRAGADVPPNLSGQARPPSAPPGGQASGHDGARG